MVSLGLSVALGAVAIPLRDLLAVVLPRATQDALGLHGTASATNQAILLQIRLPRTVLTALVGSALAGSGAAYQGLFRNPLADPYLLGVASGAGLGAIVAMMMQASSASTAYARVIPLPSLSLVPLAAFVGALLTVLAVYRIAARAGSGSGLLASSVSRLILAGVAVGSFATALTTFVMLRLQGDLHRSISWILGGFAMGGWDPVLACLPFVALGLIALCLLGRLLNVLQFGDEQAQELGLDVARVRLAIVVAASLATAAAVAFSGLIGFVGLAVPHLVRLLWTSDYRRLLPLSILLGASALLLADVLARTLIAPQEIPVGIVTALFGAPFFLYQLRRPGSASL